jgi:hypothetical protein
MTKTNQLYLFFYLQGLDILTTLAFLANGVGESNPLVRVALGFTGSPVLGLILVKVCAVVLGMYCWNAGRNRLLGRVNAGFAAVVVWNLVAIIVSFHAGLRIKT